jgi:glycosyltransferase involved in cell wall biosynthesis
LLQGFDAVLSTSVKVINGRDYCIAGKTFEYLASDKPILAYVKEGAQRDVLEGSKAGLLVDPDNQVEAIEAWTTLLSGEAAFSLDLAYVERYSEAHTLAELSNLLDCLKR